MELSTSRRNFLRVGSGGLLSAAVMGMTVQNSRAASTTTISGQFVSESGGDVSNDEINAGGGPGYFSTKTDGDGNFSVEVPTNARYEISFYKADDRSDFEGRKNGVPHIYSIGEVSVGDSPVDIGTVTLPQADLVDVRILKPSGEPLMGAKPDFRFNGWGANGSRLSVNTDGYVVIEDADFTGAEFADFVTVEVEPPSGDEYEDRTYKKYVSISGPTEVVVTIDSKGASWEINSSSTEQTTTQEAEPTTTSTTSNQERTSTERTPTATTRTTASSSTTVTTEAQVDPTTTQTTSSTGLNESEERTRGFFSNDDGETPPLLDNMFNLTVMGFLLSVAGIIHQMLQGR